MFKSGDMFEGNWSDDQKNGQGVISYFNGDVFTGEWVSDIIICENASLLYKNGDRFTGSYKAGVRVGLGTYEFSSG